MNMQLDREIIVQGFIVLAVCVGAWMMLVEPKTAQIARLQSQIDEYQAKSSMLDEQAVRRLADRVSALRADIDDIRHRNELAFDSLKLNHLVTRIAGEHDVIVTNFQPSLGDRPGEGNDVGVTGIDMSLEGNYEDIAQCMEAVSEMDGFIRPTALTVSSVQRDGRQLVSVRYSVEALSFALPGEFEEVAEAKIDAVP